MEPEHKLHGKAETRNNYYNGKKIGFQSYSYITLKGDFVKVPGNALDDGVLYSFQVSSVSLNNHEAFSTEYEILTPHYRIVQAVSVGAVGLLILLALAVVLFYTKRHLFTSHDK